MILQTIWRTGATLLLAIPAASPIHAQVASPGTCDGGRASDCRLLLAATMAFTDMLRTADPTPLRRHLDPRALWITVDGKVRSGADLIETVGRDAKRATATIERADVRFFGDVAIVTWQESWTAPDAAVKQGRLAGVDTWAQRGRTWKLVKTAEVRLAP
ncbi:nuclear transport factor 2 family protein [Sphingomonas sp. Y38-1Y]|uniref:nuclear transport factor 2 family protein n=1 Tax=Sphingomonas sp. Y38-1Y TaxID=3078265 RepID=UPI0028EE37D7|nr:nuclear transport factor 2 family protein [Sphingomonas sp. Y38-1Y]